MYLCTITLEGRPADSIMSFGADGASHANYLAGIAIDRLHDDTGKRFDYSVRKLDTFDTATDLYRHLAKANIDI